MQYNKFVFGTIAAAAGLFLGNSAMACDAHQMAAVNNDVTHFMKWYDHVGNPKNAMTEADIAKYYAPNCKQYVNGTLVAADAPSVYKRLTALHQQYQTASIQMPLQDLLIQGNKAAIRYVV